jgi:2,3-bisphosphoglycerate-dependent phosphoglycerate mutase
MTIIMNYFDKKYDYDFWKKTTKPDLYKLVFADKDLIDVDRLWVE